MKNKNLSVVLFTSKSLDQNLSLHFQVVLTNVVIFSNNSSTSYNEIGKTSTRWLEVQSAMGKYIVRLKDYSKSVSSCEIFHDGLHLFLYIGIV